MRARRALLGLSVALIGAGVQAQTSPSAATSDTVELPPMLVEAPKAGVRWRYGTLPGFEILSCCQDSATERYALRLWRLRERLDQLVPPSLQLRFSEPTVLIFYSQHRAESLSREMLQTIGQANAASQQGAVRAPPNMDLTDPDSYDLFSILNDEPFSELITSLAYGSGGHGGADHLVLTRHFIEACLQTHAPAPPAWFTVGFAQFYDTVAGEETGFEFGPDPWLSGAEADAVDGHPDAMRPLLPLSELLGGFRAPSEDTGDARYRSVWQAEAELFVRWAVMGGPQRRQALWRLAGLASRQPMSESLFQSCFGLNYADARDELSDYLAAAVSDRVKIQLPDLPDDPDLELHDAPPEDLHRIQGDWGRRTLRVIRERYPALIHIYEDQALSAFTRAYDAGERSPRLMADLGLLYSQVGDSAQAWPMLEAAAKAGGTRPAAIAELARLRFADAATHPADENGRLSGGQVAGVMEMLRRARNATPPQLETYLVLLGVCEAEGNRPDAEQSAFLNEGAHLFPSFAPLVATAALLEARAGRLREALNLLDLGIWEAPNAGSRGKLVGIRNALAGKASK